MKIITKSLKSYVNLLKKNKPFALARYGDGEWLTILGYHHLHNSNGCTFSPELSNALRCVLHRENDYFHAILKVAKRERQVPDENGKPKDYGLSAISKFLEDNTILMNWYDGDVMLEEMLKGRLFPLIEQLREKRVMYVGNERLRGLNMRGAGFFPYVAYVEPPPLNAYTHKDEILTRVFKAIGKAKVDIIGWSSGLASKVFIDETYMRFPEITQIDFGSLYDGYFEPLDHIKAKPRNNTGSRSYIRKGGYNWNRLRLLNTGQIEGE